MKSTSSSVRPVKRRRLMEDLPGSPLDSINTLPRGQSDADDCGAFARRQAGSVAKAGTENYSAGISSSESLGTPRSISSQSAETVCFGAVTPSASSFIRSEDT